MSSEIFSLSTAAKEECEEKEKKITMSIWHEQRWQRGVTAGGHGQSIRIAIGSQGVDDTDCNSTENNHSLTSKNLRVFSHFVIMDDTTGGIKRYHKLVYMCSRTIVQLVIHALSNQSMCATAAERHDGERSAPVHPISVPERGSTFNAGEYRRIRTNL